MVTRKDELPRGLRKEKPQIVADELRDLILSGDFEEGASLGTESQLLERFGVSRPTVREALRIVQAEGLISITRGVLGGVVVHLPDQRLVARATALVLQAKSVAIGDVFDAYAVIEPAAARMLSASRGRAGTAKKLRRMVSDQKRLIEEPIRFTLARKAFHEEVVRLAGNATLMIMVSVLNDVIDRSIADAMHTAADEPASSRRSALRAHERLIELIEAGDADEAQQHWSTYLASVRHFMLGSAGDALVDLENHR